MPHLYDLVPSRSETRQSIAEDGGEILKATRRWIEAEQETIETITVPSPVLVEMMRFLEEADILSAFAMLARYDALADTSVSLLARMIHEGPRAAYPVIRAKRSTDPRAYLMHLAVSPAMLLRALQSPHLHAIPHLDRILTDPRLTPRAMAEEIYASAPRAHLVISHHAFDGAPLDQGDKRFYRTDPPDGAQYQIYDFASGERVISIDEDVAFADRLVDALEANLALADQAVDVAVRLRHQRQRAQASMARRPREHGRSDASLALDPLYAERDAILVGLIGQQAYDIHRIGLERRTEAWAAGTAA